MAEELLRLTLMITLRDLYIKLEPKIQFTTRFPTEEDLRRCDKIDMTSTEEWKPRESILSSDGIEQRKNEYPWIRKENKIGF